jgi:hypothetical protein
MPGASDVYAQLKNVIDSVEALERSVNRIVAAVAASSDAPTFYTQLRSNVSPLPSTQVLNSNL